MKTEQIKKLIEKMTLTQRVAFAIMAAQKVCNDPVWLPWAKDWLEGKNRSRVAAAKYAARAACATCAAWAVEAADAAESAYWTVLVVECALLADPGLNLDALAKKAMAIK